MELLNKFKKYVISEKLFSEKDHLLIAVSGGADSMVLCKLCHLAGYTFTIAHCNFGLRGSESNEDEKFVQAFASKLDVSFLVKHFETYDYANHNKLSIQVAARELRYQWFNELLNAEDKFTHLLTAHHADDNVETVMMNFFKGSGVNGLRGILPKKEKLIRPLLFANKEMILSFAEEVGIPFRNDSSNESDKYTRNFFRNQLIPSIEKVFPQVKENIGDNIVRFRGVSEIYSAAIKDIKSTLLFVEGVDVQIPVLKLRKTLAMETVLYEIIKDYGFSATQLPTVLQLLESETGKYVVSPTHRILRNRKWLIISPLQSEDNRIFLLEEGMESIEFGAGKINIHIRSNEEELDPSEHVAQLSTKDLVFPLIIRKWKSGDYFYPLGMTKKKKINRFLIDQKLSLSKKENTWVVVSNHRIVWVIGLRIDNRFKVATNDSKRIKLTFLPA